MKANPFVLTVVSDASRELSLRLEVTTIEFHGAEEHSKCNPARIPTENGAMGEPSFSRPGPRCSPQDSVQFR